jgi:DNA-binding transcriptional LysR family regulator
MELRHLRYFIVLSEELHFGRAAARLFMSQPPLSRQIKELELELGVTLFLRDNKRVQLTEAGKYFASEVNYLLKRLEQAKTQLKKIDLSLAGEIKIGYISSIDKKKFAILIRKLHEAHPYLQTKLFELSTEKQIQALLAGRLDLGIIRGPNLAASITSDNLYKDGFCLVLPADMHLPEDFATLGKIPFISYPASHVPVYHHQMLAYAARLGFTPGINYECNNMAAILELVGLGEGISIVPADLMTQYHQLNIQFYKDSVFDIKTEVLLAYPSELAHPGLSTTRQLIFELFKH